MLVQQHLMKTWLHQHTAEHLPFEGMLYQGWRLWEGERNAVLSDKIWRTVLYQTHSCSRKELMNSVEIDSLFCYCKVRLYHFPSLMSSVSNKYK